MLELLGQKFYPEHDDLTHWLSELEATNWFRCLKNLLQFCQAHFLHGPTDVIHGGKSFESQESLDLQVSKLK